MCNPGGGACPEGEGAKCSLSGPSMVFTNVVNPRSHIPRKHEFKEILVKKGATIGANATIVCGHTIGRYAFIGAGAVVTKDVPDYALMLGNPAKVTGWMCKCGHQLDFQSDIIACSECGKEYIQSGENVSAFEDRKKAKEGFIEFQDYGHWMENV